VLSLALAGCASSGREWVDSPLEVQQASALPATGPMEAPSDARPRLDHTVTLGESYATYPAAAHPVAPGVQVNVTTPVVINNHYGGYGYGYGYTVPYTRGGAVVTTAPRVAQPASQKVGADFPAPPDYGPRALR
jgi:hypothetical protein